MSAPATNLVLRHAWKLGFAVLALALLTARGATQEGPVQLHQRALQAVASDGPTNVPCGALPAGTTTWTAAHSPYILPLNTTNDPTQPSSACAAFPLPGQAQPNPLPGVIVQPGSTLVIDASLGPVQIFSHGAGITVNGGTLQTINTGVVNGVLDAVTFDAEPDVASWDGIQILASDNAHRGNASLGYTSIGHALTSITITSGATSTANPSGQAGTVPYGLALYNSAIGPSYFDGIDVTDTPISFIGEQAATSAPITQPRLADGLFGTINNIGSQGVNLTYDGAAPANSAGVDIEGTAFGSSVPFGDTTCPALSSCAAGTIGNNAIQATFAQAPAVPVTLIDNRFYRAGSYGVELTNADGPQITNNLFDCNGSGTPKPLVTPCTGNGLKYSAIYLNNATVDLENKVTGNSGQEDGLDAIVFSGTVTSPTFNWKNATNDLNNQHLLGYLIDGGMSMNGGTFNVPGGSVVKVKDGAINLTNTKLDASDGGSKVFTSLRDNANITSCPSVFVQSCPSPLPSGEWTGIDVGSQASANLNNVSLLYPTTGVMAQGAKGVTITQSIAGASNIGPTFADGITAVNTPLSVSNTSFGCPANVCTGAAIGDQGISADYTSAGGTLAGALTVTGNTFQSSVNEAIIATGLAGQPVDIESNGITNAGGFGINLQGADHLTLKNNTIANSGLASPTHSAIYLNGVTNADFGNLISGNTGTGNGLNAIVFHGSTGTPLSWQTVGLPNTASPNPLGYMLDGDLGVAGNLTLATTDPRGDYVPVMNGGKITLSGALTGSNATFTSFKEHSRMPTCGSVFVPKVSGACQAAAAGDWGGLILAANKANSLTGSEIRYAATGISIGNPGVALTADNLTLTNTNIRNTVFDGLHSQSPVTVSGGTFSNNGASAINVDLTSGGVIVGRNLDIEGASISGSGSDGIVGFNLTGQPATISGVAVDRSGGYGIDLKGADKLTLTDNLVTNAAKNFAAIYLNGYNGDFANNVTGNKGARNGLDALVFHGTVTGNLTWQTARKTNDPTRPLGYLLDNSLSMPNAGTTLTVNAGDIVKVGNGGTLLLEGVTLRADNTSTSAQKIFTSLTDNTAGVAACPSQLLATCTAPAAGDWGGINLSGSTANGSLVNAAIRYAGTGIDISNSAASTPTSSSFGLVVSRSSISSSQGDALDALNTSVSVIDSTITGAVHGINTTVIGSGVTAYLRLSGNRFMSTSAEAILGQALGGQPVWITDNHIQDAAPFGIRLVGANALVLRNNNINCSGLGNETCTPNNAPPYPAIYLDGVSADFASNVRGNVGANNGMDVLAFHGDVNSDLNWLTPTVNATTQRLGYLLNGAVRVNDGTLKVHAGDVVKSVGGPITIRGGVLDASDPAAGTKLFTSLKDMSAYPATCPSVFTGLCSSLAAQPGDWGGLVVTNDAAGHPGSASITNGKITNAATGVTIDSGPTAQFASSGFGLMVQGTTITDVTGDAVNAQDTPLEVNGQSDIERVGSHGILATFLGGPTCGSSCPASLDVEHTTINTTSKDGIVASGLGGQPTIVSNNIITDPGTYGLRLTGADSLTLQNNTVTGSGAGYPAILLDHVSGEFTHAISGNNGSANGLNAMVFDGTANTTSTYPTFTFLIPKTAAGPFGYMLDGSLTVNGDFVSGAGVAKILSGGIKVNGLLTTSGTTFTSMKDPDPASMSACPSVFVGAPCTGPSSTDWAGINVDPVGISTFTDGGIRYATSGLTIATGELDVNGAIITNVSGYAVQTAAGGRAVVGCSDIHDNGGGFSSAGGTGSSIADSNLVNNDNTGIDLNAGADTTATNVWWGTYPPAATQHSATHVTINNALTQERPSVTVSGGSISMSSDNTNSISGHFGKGTLTVTLAFDRGMNLNVPLSVNYQSALDGVLHPVIGDWAHGDNFTWVGHALIDGTGATGAEGVNTLSISQGTSCVPDGNNVMTAESAPLTLDFTKAAVDDSAGASHIGAHSATVNGAVNPQGWSSPSANPNTETYGFVEYAPLGTQLPDPAGLIAGTTNPSTLLGYTPIGHAGSSSPLSKTLTGLLPNTTYHYEVIGVDLNGISPGGDRQFTTTDVAKNLVLSGASSTTAGDTYNFTVTAEDQFNNTVDDYTGTVAFALVPANTGSSAPAPYTFTAFSTPPASPGDDGTQAFTARLTKAPTQSISASDAVAAIAGQLDVTVNPAAASTLAVTDYPSPTIAGLSQPFTVTAKDPYGNTATGYSGTVDITSSDPQAVVPTTPQSLTNGTGSLNATLETAGNQSITATDHTVGTINGTQSAIQVNPADASKMVVSGYPSPTIAGQSQPFTVTAKDPYGNTATGYSGTVDITSSDLQAVVPTTPQSLTNGTGSLNATLKTAGSQSIIATDHAASTITGAQSGIAVNPAGPTTLAFGSAAQNLAVNATSSLMTVDLLDNYGNSSGTSADLTINLASSSGTGQFFDTTNSVVTSETMGTGTHQVQFSYQDSASGNPVLTASAAAMHDATQTEAEAAKLAFTTTSQVVKTGAVSGTITVQMQDGSGTPVSVATPLVVDLQSSSLSGAFRNAADTTTITSVSIATGTSTASFKFKDTSAGAPTVTAHASGPALTDAMQTETVADKLVITSPAYTGGSALTVGTASGPITVQLQDASGSSVLAGSSLTLQLVLSSDDPSGHFRDSADTMNITTVSISSGSSDATFLYTPGTSGVSPTITVQLGSGITDAQQTESVN